MKAQLTVAFLLAIAASGAPAQKPMFKSTMPDGSIVYSEKPVPNAKQVDTIAAPPAQSGVTTVTPQERARAEQLKRERMATTASSSRDLEAARQQLQKLEASREASKEPLPGERLGTVSGASRLTDQYHERQKSLDAALEDARKRVQELQAGR